MGKSSRTGFVERREFFKLGATFLTALSVPAVASTARAETRFPKHMRVPGRYDQPYGMPAPYENDTVRIPLGKRSGSLLGASMTPIQQQKGIITPAGLHFTTHHSGIPDIDPDQHQLYIHGLTERPLKFSVRDLMRYPLSGNIHFLECAGNSWWQGYMPNAADKSCAELHGLISGSEWIGVPVKLLLQEAGLKPSAKWVIAEGADSGTHARSIPIEKIMDDAIIALYQNGERLRPEQGYPMRLFLPGWEGNTNVKWLRRLEVTDQPAHTKDESRAYTETLADGSIEAFSLRMGVKSVITHPSAGQQLPDTGFYEVQGLAWSGFGRIKSVEVSDDGGRNWYPAQLEGPVLPQSLTRFSLPWRWNGQEVKLLSRAVDDFGNKQPTHQAWKNIYYHGSYNHYNAIQTWHISNEGVVKNVF